jgi:glycerophosphoryl diester phosphodiesterase
MSNFQVLAHRGLVSEFVPENTLKAFADALHAGAHVIETDVQCTKDGVAIIFHDDDLIRLAGIPKKISESSWKEISVIDIGFGKRIPSLEQALTDFPNARFNLDIKIKSAEAPVAEVVNRLQAQKRVLISSFSDTRSKRTVNSIVGEVRSSAGSWRVLGLWLSFAIGATPLFSLLTRKVSALQIPVSQFGLRFDSKRFIALALANKLEVHFWTINDVALVRKLKSLGATGVVTDNCDLVIAALKK